jgi:hydroxyacylglutathione hydrolase
MILKRFVITRFMTNCYLIGDEHTKEVAVIDPGDTVEALEQEIDQKGYQVQRILLTHGHFDHIMGVERLIEKYHSKVALHQKDAECIFKLNSSFEQLEDNKFDQIPIATLLHDGDTISVGSVSLKVIHTPGHTPGSICLFTNDILFSGDTLFHHSVGRTDFPFGSDKDLVNSVQRLYQLPDDTKVYPGHGFSTTIGEEKANNLVVRAI